MNTTERAEWRLPFTVADEAVIDGLDDATRAAVERYRLSGPPPASPQSAVLSAMEDAISEIDRAVWMMEDARSAVETAVAKWKGEE